MKSKIKGLISIFIFSTVLLSGCGKNNGDEKSLTSVKKYTAFAKEYENSLSYSGYAAADELKRFSFESAGKIEEIYVEKGDRVKKGQVLATLDTETIQMAIDSANESIALARNNISVADTSISDANIGLKSAQLTLEKLQTNIDTANITLKKTQDSYNSAIAKIQLNYDDLKNAYEDAKVLYEAGGCSRDTMDTAKLAFDTVAEELSDQQTTMKNDIDLQNKNIESLQSDYALQQEQIETQKNKIESAQQQKQAYEISLNQAEIALEQNEKTLRDASLKSTIDGYVTEVPMNAGEVTNAGTAVVIVKSDAEIINVAIPTDDYTNFSVGMEARLAEDDVEIYGKITAIDLYPDESTRTYNLEITPNENNVFALGSLVNVTVSLDTKNLVSIPMSSICDIDGIDYVYIIDKDAKGNSIVKSQEITIEEVGGDNVYISGIDPGTVIAADEVKNLHDNQIIKVIGG